MTLRQDALAFLEAALAAVEPGPLVEAFLLSHPETTPNESTVHLAAVGKAAVPMAAAASRVLGDRLAGGMVIVPGGSSAELPGVEIVRGGHPVPDEGSMRGGRALHALASQLGDGDTLLCLISGGGSALVALPPDEVSLADIRGTTDLLMRAGASIQQLNTVRKHLDLLKGGRLARLAAPARLEALVLSDVVGDPLDVIASGPVSPDSSTFDDAIAVLRGLGLWGDTPAAVRAHLERGRSGNEPESPPATDPCFGRVRARVIGNNRMAAEAALAKAAASGYRTHLWTTTLTGEASQAGAALASLAKTIRATGQPVAPPALIVSAGETTVTVRGSGLGGRNQELALGAAAGLDGLQDVVLLSAGTDGIDGPTSAAGALVTGTTLARARELGLDGDRALSNNDSHPFFEALGDLIVTGPTGTNVMDLQLLLVGEPNPSVLA